MTERPYDQTIDQQQLNCFSVLGNDAAAGWRVLPSSISRGSVRVLIWLCVKLGLVWTHHWVTIGSLLNHYWNHYDDERLPSLEFECIKIPIHECTRAPLHAYSRNLPRACFRLPIHAWNIYHKQSKASTYLFAIEDLRKAFIRKSLKSVRGVLCACSVRVMRVLFVCHVRVMWVLSACYVRAMCVLCVCAVCLLCASCVRAMCSPCAC